MNVSMNTGLSKGTSHTKIRKMSLEPRLGFAATYPSKAGDW